MQGQSELLLAREGSQKGNEGFPKRKCTREDKLFRCHPQREVEPEKVLATQKELIPYQY